MYQLESDKFYLDYEVARKDYEARIKKLFVQIASDIVVFFILDFFSLDQYREKNLFVLMHIFVFL